MRKKIVKVENSVKRDNYYWIDVYLGNDTEEKNHDNMVSVAVIHADTGDVAIIPEGKIYVYEKQVQEAIDERVDMIKSSDHKKEYCNQEQQDNLLDVVGSLDFR